MGWVDHLQACQQGGPGRKIKGCDVHQVRLLDRLPGLVSASGDPWTHWSSTPPFAGECATWAAKNRAHHPGGKLSCAGRGGLITFKLANLITFNQSRGVFFENNGTTYNMSQVPSQEEDFVNTVAVLPQIDAFFFKTYSRAHVTFDLGSTKLRHFGNFGALTQRVNHQSMICFKKLGYFLGR